MPNDHIHAAQWGYYTFGIDFDDLIVNEPYTKPDSYARLREWTLRTWEKHGVGVLYDPHENDPEFEGFDPSAEPETGKEYKGWQLERMADSLLRADTKRELCRECGNYGEETGEVKTEIAVDDDGVPITNDEGAVMLVEFPQLECVRKHTWYKGEGKARGNGGENAILFKEHLDQRKRREIYTEVGVPEPGLVSGMYNRTHPQGRRVNSKEQRTRNGASFFR